MNNSYTAQEGRISDTKCWGKSNQTKNNILLYDSMYMKFKTDTKLNHSV